MKTPVRNLSANRFLLVVGLATSSVQFPQAAMAHFAWSLEARKPAAYRPQSQLKRVKVSELFSEGLPAGLVRFSVPDPTGRHLGIPRIAVLDPRRLEIFKPVDEQGEMLDLEFDLTNPKGVIGEWSDLTILPSGRGLPGIVLYGGGAFFREQATVVCYVAGRFQVVFQGHDVNFIDFDLDGYPEILEEHYANEDAAQPEATTVWAWNGQKYVVAIKVRGKEFCSRQVLEAIRRVAAARK